MRYDKSKQRFGSKRCPAFWKNNIQSLTALCQQATSQSVFIAIDFEGFLDCENNAYQGITDVGLAVVCPKAMRQRKPQPGSLSPPGLTLETIIEQNDISSYSFLIKGRHQTARSIKRREPLYFDKAQWAEEAEIEATLATLLASVRDEFSGIQGRQPTMVLVGYSMDAEFAVLNTMFPQIISGGFFSAWIDLQEIANDMCDRGYKIGLQDALLSLGFSRGTLSRFSKHLQHSAGNDVIRELAILVHLLHYAHLNSTSASTPTLKFWPCKYLFPRTVRQKGRGQSRPRPFDQYPFTASVSLETGRPMLNIARDEHALYDMFSEYQPTATAMRPGGLYGWVCLPTEEIRAKFVADVDGKPHRDQVWRARALSTLELPTCSDRRKMQDARNHENGRVQENKQQERRAWRETVEAESESLSLDMALLEIEAL